MAPLKLFLYVILLPYVYQFEGFALALCECHHYVPNKKHKLIIFYKCLLLLTWVDGPVGIHIVFQHGSTQAGPPMVAVPGRAHLGMV